MKIAVWGAGLRGRRLYNILPKDSIAVFIDSDIAYNNQSLYEIPIVSFKKFKQKYELLPILISPHYCESIIYELEKAGLTNYWILSNEIMAMYAYEETNITNFWRNSYEKKKKYLLKGCRLFSLFQLDFFKKNGLDITLLFDNDTLKYKDKMVNATIAENISLQNINWTDYDELLIEPEFYESSVDLYSDKVNCKLSYIDPIQLKAYNYNRLSVFKNIHKNKRCFIVANGPSLTVMDLEKLHNHSEISFAVNHIYKETTTNWLPTYYVIADVHTANYNFNDIIQYGALTKFILDASKLFWKNTIPMNIYKYYVAVDYSSTGINVSNDITQGVYLGKTVIQVCLQIAMYMGFKKIYLIGADTTPYSATKNSHFIKNYHSEFKKTVKNPHLDIKRIISGYQSINRYAKQHDIKIYNATRGGELEVFERIEFNELFK